MLCCKHYSTQKAADHIICGKGYRNMGNWSPYSEEWEKNRIRKVIDETEAARREFEQKPWLYKVIVKYWGTICYYWNLLKVHIRMFFDRDYREKMKHEIDGGIKVFADMIRKYQEDDS